MLIWSIKVLIYGRKWPTYFKPNCQCLRFKCLKFVRSNDLYPYFSHNSHSYSLLFCTQGCTIMSFGLANTEGEISSVAGWAPWKAAPVIATSRVFNNPLVSIISCGAGWHSPGLTAITFSARLQNVARNVSPAVGIIICNACPSCVGAV